MTFSAAQTSAKAGAGWRYLLKRVELAAKIETSKEVSPHDLLGIVGQSFHSGLHTASLKVTSTLNISAFMRGTNMV